MNIYFGMMVFLMSCNVGSASCTGVSVTAKIGMTITIYIPLSDATV